MRSLLLFVPIELLSLVIVAAGLAFVVGAHRIGTAMLGFAAAMALLPPLLAPLFDALPETVLWLVMAALAAGMLFGALRAASVSLIGRDATNTMVGELAARTVLGTVRLAGRVALALLKIPLLLARGLLGR